MATKNFNQFVEELNSKGILNKTKSQTNALREFYYGVGWALNNLTSLRTDINSRDEATFVKHYGNAEHTVVSQAEKTSNGKPMKYGTSAYVLLNKKSVEGKDLPDYFKGKVVSGKTSCRYNNKNYVYTLVNDLGFNFGKATAQDYSTICENVPLFYKKDFKNGFEA